ncbi:CoxG family protein [Oceanobacillus halotolerans]|uniref:CoxG family protein n=1 Tax=Oceanobacillus halotolerans TaxID=2663380 RepID=UPI0013DAF804|nr:SRPBCC family protein [Oceanobacillus halotolerans]
MPSGSHKVALELPITHIWRFVSNVDNWAPLVPGYIHHEILNDKQSNWKFKGDLGFVQKTIYMKIDITKWQEPNKVTFDLTGLNENFKGNGYFEAEALTNEATSVTGHLNINAKGMTGPMINSVLKSFVPKITKEFTETVANHIMKTKPKKAKTVMQ